MSLSGSLPSYLWRISEVGWKRCFAMQFSSFWTLFFPPTPSHVSLPIHLCRRCSAGAPSLWHPETQLCCDQLISCGCVTAVLHAVYFQRAATLQLFLFAPFFHPFILWLCRCVALQLDSKTLVKLFCTQLARYLCLSCEVVEFTGEDLELIERLFLYVMF